MAFFRKSVIIYLELIAMILVVPVILVVLGVFVIAPARSKRAEAWRGTAFAHRGLHGEGVDENTLEAFERACRLGVGIELDVQMTRDGELVVFHDEGLTRLAGDPRRVDEVDWAELKAMTLKEGGRVPAFEEVLKLVDGRVPLLVELKSGRSNRKLCEGTMALLKAYEGRYVVESFNPLMLRWLRKNAPEVVRGQLVGAKPSYLAVMGWPGAVVLSTLSLNFLARPDFVAYDVEAKHFATPRVQRLLFHTTMAAWTVRDEETWQSCMARNEMPIFEDFVPEQLNA